MRTTIDPKVQEAAVTALAGRFGGIAVMRPSDGEVLGLAGIAYSAPQPPGSTFKIVTLAGLLDAGVVKRNAKFPVETSTTLEGVELENANGEACGGSLRASFAESCNSVFAPLGAKLGAKRLVETAEKFGFNEEPPVLGAASLHDPARRRDRRRPGGRLDRDRPGQGAHHAAADGRDRRDDRPTAASAPARRCSRAPAAWPAAPPHPSPRASSPAPCARW